ncbi:prepilin-type N-terminal cleavage/methylation domain-containing protein [bacterium]|nr:prepilin-type N-terminal cleavage/methylation domain-containing protein [bacterium]
MIQDSFRGVGIRLKVMDVGTMYKRAMGPRGFTLAEILLAITILVLCLFPVMQMLQSSSTKSSFNEYYVFAHIRAVSILDAYAGYAFEELTTLSLSPTPSSNIVEVANSMSPLPEEYKRRLDPDGWEEKCVFSVLGTDGLGKLRVLIRWKFPGPQQPWREYQLERIVMRRNLSLVQQYNL